MIRAMQSRSVVCHLIGANIDTAYFRSIARHHASDQFPVLIGSVAPTGALQEAMRGIGVRTFSLRTDRRSTYPATVLRLAHLLTREKVGILHAHCFDPTLVGLLAGRMSRTRFVFTRHHSDNHIRMGKRWHTRVDGWCARRADRVIAVSEATRRILIDVERVPANRITVVYNGMEPLAELSTSRVEALRSALGLTGERVCLTAARLHEEKGHSVLFAAIPEILRRCGPTVFLLAGSGPHRGALETEAARLGIERNVRFLGQRSDIADLTHLADLAIVPSLAESFGFVVLEAMSAGKPVVAAATGGIPELIADGETGLLVPTGDSKSLAEAVSHVLTERVRAGQMGEAGRTRAAEFSFERMIRGYETVYADLLRLS